MSVCIFANDTWIIVLLSVTLVNCLVVESDNFAMVVLSSAILASAASKRAPKVTAIPTIVTPAMMIAHPFCFSQSMFLSLRPRHSNVLRCCCCNDSEPDCKPYIEGECHRLWACGSGDRSDLC